MSASMMEGLLGKGTNKRTKKAASPVVAAAVADPAQYLVSYDKDLLDLTRPYGIECIRPHAFIRALLGKS